MEKFTSLLLFITLFFLLPSCGSNTAPMDSFVSNSTASKLPASTTPSNVAVYYTKGPVTDGKCVYHDIKTKEDIVTSDRTIVGRATVSLPSYGNPVLITCSGGFYTDEATASIVQAPTLRAIKTFTSSDTKVVVTAITELATRMSNDSNYNDYPVQMVKLRGVFGLNQMDLTSVEPTDVVSNSLSVDDAGKYAMVNATFSQLLKEKKIGSSFEEIIDRIKTEISNRNDLDVSTKVAFRNAFESFRLDSPYKDNTISFSKSNANVFLANLPIVESVSPIEVTENQEVTFRVIGKRLSSSLSAYLGSSVCATPSVESSTSYTVVCSVKKGEKSKTDPSANYTQASFVLRDANNIDYPDSQVIKINPVVASTPSTVTVFYTKGPVTDGICTLLDIKTNSNIGDTPKTIEGRATISIPSYDSSVLVSCTGGFFKNEVNGQNTNAPQLRAVKTFTGTDRNVVVSPMTELAVLLSTEANYSDFGANSVKVKNIFGLSGFDLTQVEPTDLINTALTTNASGRYAMVLATISQLRQDGVLGNTYSAILNELKTQISTNDNLANNTKIQLKNAFENIRLYGVYKNNTSNFSKLDSEVFVAGLPIVDSVTPTSATVGSNTYFVFTGRRLNSSLNTFLGTNQCATPSVSLDGTNYTTRCRVVSGSVPTADPGGGYTESFIELRDSSGIVYPTSIKIRINP